MQHFLVRTAPTVFFVFFAAASELHAKPSTKKMEPEAKRYAAYGEGAAFQMDKGLVDKLYEEKSSTTSPPQSAQASVLALTPKLGAFRITALTTQNNYFTSHYEDNFETLPFAEAAAKTTFLRYGKLRADLTGSIAYAFKQSPMRLQTKENITLEDNVTLHWLPANVGTSIGVILPWGIPLEPAITVGIGTSLLKQSGELDGVTQDFLMTHYNYGVELGILRGRNASSGYNLTFAASQWKQLPGAQPLDATAYSLGAEIHL